MTYINIPHKALFLLHFSFIILYSTFSYPQSNTDSLIQNLKSQIVNSKDDTTHINLLIKLANEYIYTAPDTALIYAEQALAIAVQLFSLTPLSNRRGAGGEVFIANSHHTIGHAHYVMGNYEQVLTHWQQALEIRKRNNDKKDISASLCNIGLVYYEQGNYPKALSYYFSALEMDSVLGDKSGIAADLSNIGLVYWNQGNYPKALSYYSHALEMDSVLGDKSGIAANLGNIGLVYNDQGNYPKALSYYSHALEMDSVLGNKRNIATHLGNIGGVYHAQASTASPDSVAYREQLFPKALSYYFHALEMDSVLGNKSGIARHLGNIGSLYASIKQYAKSENYLLQSLVLSDSIGTLHHAMSVEKSISELYEEMANDTPLNPLSRGDLWQLAYNHHVLYSNIRDTVFGEEKNKAVGRVEMKHEMEMEEYRKKVEEEERKRQEAVAVARRDILQYSLILLVLGVLFVVVLFSRRLMAKLPDKILFIKVDKAKAGFAFIFIFIMMLFESMLLFADPYITTYAQGAPGIALLINALIACILFPVNYLLEKVLGKKVGSGQLAVGSGPPSSNTTGMLMGMVVVALFNSFTLNEKPDTNKQVNNRTIEQLNNRTLELGATKTLKHEISQKTFSWDFVLSCFGGNNFFYGDSIKQSNSQIEQTNIQTKADSLLSEMKKPGIPDTQKVNILNALFLEYEFTDAKKASKYITQALQISEKINYYNGISKTYTHLGFFADDTGNYAAVLSWFQKALEIDSVSGNESRIATHLGNIGNVYNAQGNYPTALSYYFKALEMDSVMGNKRGIAKCLGNIGIVYMEQGNYPKALSYYFKALEMDSVMGNKRGIAIKLGNIGGVYHEQGNYPTALSYFFKALEIDSVMGNKREIAIKLGNIGNVYKEQGNYPTALSYFFKALEIDSVLGNKRNIAAHLGNIGSLYTTLKQYAPAEKYLKQSLALSDSIGTLKYTMDFEKSLTELYAQMANDTPLNSLSRGDLWQKAYNHHVAYRTARDSVFGEEKSKAVGRVEMKHEMEMEEYRKKVEEEERRRQEAVAVGRRNELQYSAIFIGFIVLLSVVFMLSRLVLPVWLIEFLTFVPFLILFEFILVLLDPHIDAITAGAPALRLLFNAVVAGLLYPLQQFSEHKLKLLFYWKKRKINLKMR